MAFNLSTFKTRALTAIVFVVVMLAGLLWNHWSFLLLFSIIHFGCWIEYQKLVALIDPVYSETSGLHKILVIIAGYGLILWFTNEAYVLLGVRLHELGWWMLMICAIVLPVSEVLLSKNFSLRSLMYSLAGLVYISLSWGLMIALRNGGAFLDLGWIVPCVLIAAIWINDTMAYIVGSFIGRTPLSPISPKKTWEGTIGGALLCIAVVTLVGYFGFGLHAYGDLIAISAITAVVGTIGDLLQSKLKRLAGVKDSGNIMPGHGGFLDRFDSLLLATPFVWLYIAFVTNYLH
jgi:phosphatidate cytidylyltransferase